MKTPLEVMKDELEAQLDIDCPKGKAKSNGRGAGLALIGIAMLEAKRIVKAFGGCFSCWGKGYCTATEYAVAYKDFPDHEDMGEGMRSRLPTVRYCKCERGQQLKARILEFP